MAQRTTGLALARSVSITCDPVVAENFSHPEKRKKVHYGTQAIEMKKKKISEKIQ